MARRPGDRWASDARPLRVPDAVLDARLELDELGLYLRAVAALRRARAPRLELPLRAAAALVGCRRGDAAVRALARLAELRDAEGDPLLEVAPATIGANPCDSRGLRDAIDPVRGAIASGAVTIAAPKWAKLQGFAPTKPRRSPSTRRSTPIPARNPARKQENAPTVAAVLSKSIVLSTRQRPGGQEEGPAQAAPERPAAVRAPAAGRPITGPERPRGGHALGDVLAGLRLEGPEPAPAPIAPDVARRLAEVRARLGAPLDATRTVRELLAALPWAEIARALDVVNVARKDGRTLGNVGGFFVGVLRQVAAERGLAVGGPRRAPRPAPAPAARMAP